MKLQEYFEQQKNSYIPEADKFHLYEKIITQKNQTQFSRKKKFLHIKSIAYSSLALVFIIGIYGSWFVNTVDTDTDGFIVKTIPNIKGVQANYIAQIVDFNGNFYIQNENGRVQTSNIQSNDTVILEEGTEMVFHIDGQTQAKIIGPAEFTIEKVDNNGQEEYKLKLAYYGDLVEMISLNEESTQDIEIQTPELTVRPSNCENSNIKFQLIKENNKQIVKNQGSQLSVIQTQTDTDTTIETQIETEQLASIEANDIKILSIEEFDQAIHENAISQVFKIFDDKEHNENNTGDKNNSELALLNTETSIEEEILSFEDNGINTGVIENLGDIVLDSNILTPDQNTVLRANLNPTFLTNDFQSLFVGKVSNDTVSFNIAYNSINQRINKICESFDINPNSNIKTTIDSLKNTLNNYSVPPRYITNLTSIQRGLDIIYAQNDTNLSTEEAESIWTNTINSQISFK